MDKPDAIEERAKLRFIQELSMTTLAVWEWAGEDVREAWRVLARAEIAKETRHGQ